MPPSGSWVYILAQADVWRVIYAGLNPELAGVSGYLPLAEKTRSSPV